MSLLPLEKIATDHLDDLALVKLGFSPFWGHLPGRIIMGGLRGLGHLGMGTTRLAGKGMWGSAKLFGRTAQMAGNVVINHPGMAMSVGVPAAFAVSNLPERLEVAQNNIYPENPYMY